MKDMVNDVLKTITAVAGMFCLASVGKEGVVNLREHQKNKCELDKIRVVQEGKTRRSAARCKTVTEVIPGLTSGLARFI